MQLPGFTAEQVVKAQCGRFSASGSEGIADKAGCVPAVFGPPRPPYPDPIFGSYCDYSTGKQWCIGYIGRHGAVGQIQCGTCGNNSSTGGGAFSQF
jgi:hypothetical protein